MLANIIMLIVCFVGLPSLIVGFFTICNAIWNESGYVKVTKRNKQKNSVLDDAAIQIIKFLNDPATQRDWRTQVVKYKGGWSDEEKIIRADEKIIISKYKGDAQYLEIEIDAIGTFRGRDLKPSIANDLAATCAAFQQLVAVTAILKPQALISANAE
jgi:hypothetical protein